MQNQLRPEGHSELIDAVLCLVTELREVHQAWRSEQEWRRRHSDFATKHDLQKLKNIMASTQKELIADLALVNEKQLKTAGEIATLSAGSDALAARVKELEAVVANGGEVTQELIDAVAAVKNQAQIVDDLIPDVVPVPPVE